VVADSKRIAVSGARERGSLRRGGDGTDKKRAPSRFTRVFFPQARQRPASPATGAKAYIGVDARRERTLPHHVTQRDFKQRRPRVVAPTGQAPSARGLRGWTGGT